VRRGFDWQNGSQGMAEHHQDLSIHKQKCKPQEMMKKHYEPQLIIEEI